jgi:phenylpropionate dioxygenase-like ring-hydroxylating dioxygenase large terminal subunit
MLCTYVFNRVDDGTPPRKPSDIDISEARSVHLELIMPNLWQNYISEDVRVVIAFTPIDADNSILYLRFYQRFMTVPLLGKLVARLAMPFNVLVAHQDRRVVVTHQPMPSALKMDEKLIQGDLPIIEYRKKRQELINQVEI